MKVMRRRPRHWVPDFCRLPILFSTLVAAEVAVLVIWLTPSTEAGWSGGQFAAASLLAQWLALCSVVVKSPWLGGSLQVRRPVQVLPLRLTWV